METVAGRLTRDAEVRTLESGSQVVNFAIAKNKSYRDKKGNRVQLTEFVECAYWITPKIAEFLTKGTIVQLSGWMSVNVWVDDKKKPHGQLNFNADNIDFLGASPKKTAGEAQPPQGEARTENNPAQGEEPKIDDDLPF